jgi:hypothetical protein
LIEATRGHGDGPRPNYNIYNARENRRIDAFQWNRFGAAVLGQHEKAGAEIKLTKYC